ncbi:MAG: hypothetical protein JWN66_4662, partial [Sphingomonas bacterium]|uniref:hypothetical protein n=1 Tax=Sphingomonas bacterium TaxID=1895847 RepID=UPI00260A5036
MDDDIAWSLPEPPPPRPDRREAAIGEAMRRFDATGEAPPAARPRPAAAPSPWWTRINRPQFGVLVSAALVVAIGVPAALISIDERAVPVTPQAPAPAAMPSAMADSAAPPPIASPPIAPASPPKVAIVPSSSAVAPMLVPAPAPVAPPPVVLADNRVSQPPAMKLARGDIAPPPPPPPPLPAPAPAPMMQADQGYAAVGGMEARRAEAKAAAPRAGPAPAPP